MKTKIIRSLIPPLLGIITEFALLIIDAMVSNNRVSLFGLITSDTSLYLYFLPAVYLIAVIIQFTLVFYFWKRYINSRKVWGLTIVQFILVLSVIGGFVFGYLFWEPQFGFRDLLKGSFYCGAAFLVYWAVNLTTLYLIDRRRNNKQMKSAG
jgi:hypothetical protein